MSQTTGSNLIARNTAFLYIRMVVVMCVSIYTSRVVLQTLGVVDYGIYNVVAGFVALFAFLNSSFNASIQRFYNFEKGTNGDDGVTKVYNTSLCIQALLAVVVLLVAETIGLWYVHHMLVVPAERFYSAVWVYHLSVFQMLIVVLQVPYSAAIVADERMDFYAWMSIFDVVGRLAIVFFLPMLPADKLIMYAILSTTITSVGFLIYYIYSKAKIVQLKFRPVFEKLLFTSMLSFSGWNILGALSVTLRNQGVNVILNWFFGPVVNAARAVSFQIQAALLGFSNNITTAARPQLVESYAIGNIERSKNIMFGLSKVCFLVLFVLVLPISIEINYVLRIWLGDAVPEYSNIFTILILITALIDITNTPVSMIVLATGNNAKLNVASSVIGLLLLPLSFVILKFGSSPVSVYILTIVVSFSIQLSSLLVMRRIVGISLKKYLYDVVIPLAIIVVLSPILPLSVHFIMEESFLRLIIVTIVAVISVLTFSYQFGLNISEKSLAKNFIVSRFN